MMIPSEWIAAAQKRIAPYIVHTPLTYDPDLDVYIKWESHQVTGSFKARGALNKVLSLQSWEREGGLVAASAGNHGQGVALAGRIVQTPVTIFASEHAIPLKIAAMESLGARVQLVAGGYGDAENAGIAYADAHQAVWISPYNDGQVISGQATITLELLDELPESPPAVWVVPVGGGGLISGIGAALEACYSGALAGQGAGFSRISGTKPALVGSQSEASPFMHALYYRSSQEGVIEDPSLADGLSGPVQMGSITIPLVHNYARALHLVSEAEIAQALRFAWEKYQEKIEGSAAVALAAILTGRVTERPALVLMTGGNIQPEQLTSILQGTTVADQHG